MKASFTVDNPTFKEKVVKLQVNNAFHLQNYHFKILLYGFYIRSSFLLQSIVICITQEGSPDCRETIHLSFDLPQAAIKYDEDDLPGAKSMVEQCASDDPDTENNLG
jgi:hypothetical protein